MGELAITGGTSLDAVSVMEQAITSIQTKEDACAYIDKLTKLESVLNAAKIFEENARRFTLLENAAYLRIVELGYIDAITNYNMKKTLKWYSELSEACRNETLEYCNTEGISLKSYYRIVVTKEQKAKKGLETLRYELGLSVQEFKKTGHTSLEQFHVADCYKYVPSDVKKGLIDVARDRIRKLGGHGLGDGLGTYVTAEKAHDYFQEIINNKQASIKKDVGRAERFAIEIGNDYRKEYQYSGSVTCDLKHRNGSYEIDYESAYKIPLILLDFCEAKFDMPDESVPIFLACLINHFGWDCNGIHDAIVSQYKSKGYGLSLRALKALGYTGFESPDELQLLKKKEVTHD